MSGSRIGAGNEKKSRRKQRKGSAHSDPANPRTRRHSRQNQCSQGTQGESARRVNQDKSRKRATHWSWRLVFFMPRMYSRLARSWRTNCAQKRNREKEITVSTESKAHETLLQGGGSRWNATIVQARREHHPQQHSTVASQASTETQCNCITKQHSTMASHA